MFDFVTVHKSTEISSEWTIIFTLLLSFVLSTILGFVYQKTFRGLSYSRNLVQAVVLVSILAAVIIQAVGDSLARGVGIMGAMSIIRFSTSFKDPRDTLFIFASVSAGIACGAYAFVVAITGTLVFAMAAILMYYSPLGPNSYFDGMVRFNLTIDSSDRPKLDILLKKHCKSFALVTMREIAQGQRLDYAYHIKLRKKNSYESLMSDLKSIDELEGLNLMMQEATVDL